MVVVSNAKVESLYSFETFYLIYLLQSGVLALSIIDFLLTVFALAIFDNFFLFFFIF